MPTPVSINADVDERHAREFPMPGGSGLCLVRLPYVPRTPSGPVWPALRFLVVNTAGGRIVARQPHEDPDLAFPVGSSHVLRVGTAVPCVQDGTPVSLAAELTTLRSRPTRPA